MTKKIKVSAVITAHNEGILAHKTMLSIFESLNRLSQDKYTYEVVVHLDNPDVATAHYFERYQSDIRVRIVSGCFGDPGLSRNHAIEVADGEYIGVIDADDLISPNWFEVAIRMVEQSKTLVVVHPEYNLTFGPQVEHPVLWTQADAAGDSDDKILMAGMNLWISTCLASREVFERFPYPESGNGFGNEDWWFNAETMAAGIKHLVAKDVVQFYRQKRNSVLTSNRSYKSVQWPTHCIDLMEFKKIPLQSELPESKIDYKAMIKTVGVKSFRKVHGALLRTPLKYVVLPTGEVVKKIIHYKPQGRAEKKIPKSVLMEWEKINHIESQLYPIKWKLNDVGFYGVDDGKKVVGEALRCVIEPLTKLPDYVFIAPWLITGGADKVILNYIDAILEIHPDWTIAVITTEPSENEWKTKLPKGVCLIDFGNVTRKLSKIDRESVFDRLIIELRCRRVHLINSQYGYNYISDHLDLFKHNFDLIVSLFCYDYIRGSNMKGVYDYADPSLVEIYPAVRKVYTDNQAIVDRDIERNAFDSDRFVVHYQPFRGEIKEYSKRSEDGVVRILWASRICDQKMPNIVTEVAKRLDATKFHIDMYGKIEHGFKEEDFSGVDALTYKGEFNGIDSIDTSEYDVYLYTSNIDGLPNCILEATAMGLPIIAPNVGGISEFIKDRKTGFLVDDCCSAEGFIEKIEEARDKPERLKEYVSGAQKLLKTRHNFEHFVEEVRRELDGANAKR